MRFVVVILEGAADEPLAAFDGRTAMEAASIPALDQLARDGRSGTQITIPHKQAASAEASLMCCMGYDPRANPAGRGALEALAAGVEVGRQDQALRCSLVTLGGGRVLDAAPAPVRAQDARGVLECALRRRPQPELELHAVERHRALCVWRGVGALAGLETTAAHDAVDRPLRERLPRGRHSRPLAQWMLATAEELERADINVVRRDLGENPLNGIWIWGAGGLPRVPMFRERFGRGATVISDNLLMRGIAKLLRTEVMCSASDSDKSPPPASHDATATSAIAALERSDVVVVHTHEVDAAGHSGDAQRKQAALEAIDQQLIAPLAQRLRQERDWRMLVMTAHATPLGRRRHSGAAAPFVLAGSDITSGRGDMFDEQNARDGEMQVERGYELMEYFLRA